MDIKSFKGALNQIAQERGISPEKVVETIEAAIATAYKKDYGKKGQKIKAKFNPETGDVKFWQLKLVVDDSMIYSEKELAELKASSSEVLMREEEGPAYAKASAGKEEQKKAVFNPEKHIMIEDAKKENPKLKPGDELEIPLESQKEYGRIAAQTAKQVILQKIREAEKETILGEYKSKEGEIISGVIQRIEGGIVFVDIGRTLGILSRDEQTPREFYRPGQRLKFYILRVEETPKGPAVILSRSYPRLISKLFELEVPEISQGVVLIKAIAREAGSRCKIAVESKDQAIDPIGSAVGQRGTRVMTVINELGGEKIDIIEYSDDPKKFIANALSPAKVVEVKIMPKNKALCLVPEDQLSLAIGKEGQNVRLAAKLTGWKIDMRAEGKEEESSYAKATADKEVAEEQKEEEKEEVQGKKEIVEKKIKVKKTKKSSQKDEKKAEKKNN